MQAHGSALRDFQSPPRVTQAPTRSGPLDETNWWKAEAAYDDRQRQAAALRLAHQKRQEEVRLVEQNAWLGKRAKQKRFVFSADQKRMLRQWFDALDADRSGKISVEVPMRPTTSTVPGTCELMGILYQELEDPMLSIGIVSDPSEIQEIVNTLDKDANGLIDFQEFVEFLTPHHHATNKNAASQEKHERMFMQLTKKMEVSRPMVLIDFLLWVMYEHARCVGLLAPKLGLSRDQHAIVHGTEAIHSGRHHAPITPSDSRRLER